ncbi:MAG: 6-phosphogluconolactonase [Proteobacteria bacterium]|nr:6-phosphogluconolactonase [Pseudomonadota bacterium]
MNLQRLASADDVAKAGAEFIFARAGEALARRDRFILALSGGSTPWQMLRELAAYELPWNKVHVLQVDERAVADTDPERNLLHIRKVFADPVSLPPDHLHAMPVGAADLQDGARQYERELGELAGSPPIADVVHLGLGTDGHTASLLPGDPVLEISDRDVGVTGPYNGCPRMTLTYPFIDRARHILWLITGVGKAAMTVRLILQDGSIPAGRVSQQHATLIADRGAMPVSDHDGVRHSC